MSADPFSPVPDTEPCEPLEEDADPVEALSEMWRNYGPPARAIYDLSPRYAMFPKGLASGVANDGDRPRTWRSRLATRLEDLGGWCLRVLWDVAQAVRGE